jgi:hypothetical protein
MTDFQMKLLKSTKKVQKMVADIDEEQNEF